MHHQMSLQCFLDARDDSGIPQGRYRDLQELLRLFGLVKGHPEKSPASASFMGRFAPENPAPELMIVEDEPQIANQALKASLVDSGYPETAIHVFYSGEEAIFFARKHRVEIALVDVRLGNPTSVRNVYVSGLKVLTAIKETSPGAKVVLISGYCTYEMVRRALLELGASYYLDKPFEISDILRIVQWGVGDRAGGETQGGTSPPSGGASVPDQAARPPVHPPVEKRLERILVVDDEAKVAEVIALGLESCGYRVSKASGGREALRMLDGGRFDGVVLDLLMPDLGGLEVLRRIRGRDRTTVVVILTAIQDTATIQEAVRLGASEILTKPFRIDVLQFNLEYAFSRAASSG